MTTMENSKVSLVILPYDNFDYFARATISLLENTDYSNFEVIASHNPCENEETNKKIREFMEQTYEKYVDRQLFKFVVNETNLYHGPGTMEGFKLADSSSKYIGIINDDIFIPAPEINWLEKMVAFMEENEKVATVTPSLYHLKETLFWCGRKPGEAQHMYLHYPKGDPRIPKEPFMTESNNMALCLTRRYLLKEIPLGQTCPHYGSDSEFYNRVQEKYPDMEHWVIPSIKIYHDNIYHKRTNRGKDPVVEG